MCARRWNGSGWRRPSDSWTSIPATSPAGRSSAPSIARAIIFGPELLVADEPVSMLDMSVRAKILELMLDLKTRLGLTYVYVTHDLASAKFFCDRIAIMYLGRIVEIGPAEEIYADPKHPYTQALLRAIPEPDPDKALPVTSARRGAGRRRPPLGCSFHPRCPVAFEICGWESRDLRRSSKSAGSGRARRPSRPSARSSATSTSSTKPNTTSSSPQARARTRASC